MIIFCSFILLLLTLLLIDYSLYISFICVSVLLLGCLFKYKRSWFKYALLIILIGFLLSYFGKIIYQGNAKLTGIIIKSEPNYYLIKTIKGNLYVAATSNTYEVGDIISIQGNFKDLEFTHYQECFDFKHYLNSFGVYNSFYVNDVSVVFLNPLRLRLFKQNLISPYSFDSQLMILSMLFKDSISSISNYSSLYSLGIIFLFSSSNIHISFLFAIISKRLSRYISEKKVDIVLMLILLLFYVFSEYNISILRILLMYVIKFISNNTKTFKVDYLERLSLTFFIILLLNPYYVMNIGFYFSFIVLFFFNFRSSFISTRTQFKKIKSTIMFVLILLPLNFYINTSYNLLSFALQIICTPFLSFLFVVDLSVFFGSFVVPFLDRMNNLYVLVFNKVLSFNISVQIGDFKPILVIIYYIILLVVFLSFELRLEKAQKISVVLLSTLILLTFTPDYTNHYEVHFIDVGQGDATLIRYERTNILIDTGGNIKIDLANECLIKYFNRLKIRKLDAVLITHKDYDHYGALDSLNSSFKIDDIYYASSDKYSYQINNLKIDDLNTYKSNSTDTNYCSGIFRFEIKGTKFLIMGDAPIEVENKLLNDKADIDTDILKVGHHGSNTSSSINFFKTCSPSLAIISCGYNNLYKHPSKEVISYLENLKIKYIRTDVTSTYVVNI